MLNKLQHAVIKGVAQEFYEVDIPLINKALEELAYEVSLCVVEFAPDRDVVIERVRKMTEFVAMPYIYKEVCKKDRQWYANRMRERKPGGKASSFKEDDILK